MEVNIWEQLDLKRPAFLVFTVKKANFVERLHVALKSRLHCQKAHEAEFKEASALLGQIMARRKNSFRRMIGFRNLCKLNAAVRRVRRLDIQRELESLLSAIPDAAYGPEQIVEISSRNCLEYVLVRLVTLHGLYTRILDCGLRTAEYFVELIRACNFVDISTLILATVAKLMKFTSLLGNNYIDLYEVLQQHRLSFPQKGEPFLQDINALPTNLERFDMPKAEPTNSDDALVGNVEQDSEEKHIEKFLKAAPSINITSSTLLTKKSRKPKDLGIEIERKTKPELKLPEACRQSINKQSFNIETISSIDEVKRFMIVENKSRKNCLTTCITKGVQTHEWAGLQKLIERKIQSGDTKKAVQIFKKFLHSKL